MNIATSMLFAMSIPGWGSLDAVRRIHSELELAAIIFFALLALFDILSHFAKAENRRTLLERIGLLFFAAAIIAEVAGYKYGQRNDELSEQVIGSLDAKAKEASGNASKAVTDSGIALGQAKEAEAKSGHAVDAANKANAVSVVVQKKVADVQHEADVVEYVLSARRVQDEDGLEKDLRKEFAGSHIAFTSYVGDEEAFWLCSQLTDIANKAGVGQGKRFECGSEPLSFAPISDLNITAPTHEEAERLVPILKAPRRVPGIFIGARIGPRLTVLVGVKPSSPFGLKRRRNLQTSLKTEAAPKNRATLAQVIPVQHFCRGSLQHLEPNRGREQGWPRRWRWKPPQ